MRVSEHFSLGVTQPSLDFVDVAVGGDTRVFVDPSALLPLRSTWASECVSLIQNFFGRVLDDIRSGDHDRARRLLEELREPNETHLGLSHGDRARGRGLGRQSAREVWDALRESEAVQTGLLRDLEDTVLMIEGIASDMVSDITTNIIRQPLIRYTQDMCRHWGISLRAGTESGPMWDPERQEWFVEFVDLPATPAGKLLLVPKILVRQKLTYNPDEYYRHYLLPYLADEEIAAGSSLVRVIKSTGERRVTKKDLAAKYGRGKGTIVRETRRHPEALQAYRRRKREQLTPPMSHLDIAGAEGTELPDWDALLEAVINTPPGRDNADQYHRAVQALLTALFYPSLADPKREWEIHEGRKRIDVVFVNAATDGFFDWLGRHYSSAHVVVECKNYSNDVANEELDQLSGRFSPSRGRVGLLLSRSFENKDLFIQRCRDTATDDRGFIVALDDEDLRQLVHAGRDFGYASRQFALLKERFDQLIT